MMEWGEGAWDKMLAGHTGLPFVPASEDVIVRLPDLTTAERLRLLSELPAHPSAMQVQEKTVELLRRRPSR